MLPNGSEPLVLADGTKIDPVNGSVINDEILVEVPNTETIKQEIVAARKRINDLPVPPKQMNTLSVIISYSLFGLSDHDIAYLLSIETKELEKFVKGLQKNYKFIFNTEEGKEVLTDLEKRCHYHSTTNVKGDSHESAYMEGQRSVILFIKSMLRKDKET